MRAPRCDDKCVDLLVGDSHGDRAVDFSHGRLVHRVELFGTIDGDRREFIQSVLFVKDRLEGFGSAHMLFLLVVS